MKTKILMLVGVAASVIFLSTSAFASLTLVTEKIDRGYYFEVVIKVQNDRSDDYRVGIQSIKKRIDSEVNTSEIREYDELGNPVLMLDTEELLDREGIPLFSRIIEIEMAAPVDDEGIMTINGLKHITTVPEVVEERIFFINKYNLQGVKVYWFEGILKPDAVIPDDFREISPGDFSRQNECYLLPREYGEEDEDGPFYLIPPEVEERPFYYPSEPLYTLHEIPGGREVELGSIFVPKPEGDEILPVFVFDIHITDNAADPLIGFVVDPNIL